VQDKQSYVSPFIDMDMRSFVALPPVAFKITAAIHRKALMLWLKGVRLVPRPVTAPAKSQQYVLGER